MYAQFTILMSPRSGWEEAVTFLNLGPKFRKHRKMLQNAFSPVNCIPYRSKQEDLARVLVRSLLDNPLEWERLLVRYNFHRSKML